MTKSEKKALKVIGNTPEAVFICNASSSRDVVALSAPFVKMLGYPSDALVASIATSMDELCPEIQPNKRVSNVALAGYIGECMSSSKGISDFEWNFASNEGKRVEGHVYLKSIPVSKVGGTPLIQGLVRPTKEEGESSNDIGSESSGINNAQNIDYLEMINSIEVDSPTPVRLESEPSSEALPPASPGTFETSSATDTSSQISFSDPRSSNIEIDADTAVLDVPEAEQFQTALETLRNHVLKHDNASEGLNLVSDVEEAFETVVVEMTRRTKNKNDRLRQRLSREHKSNQQRIAVLESNLQRRLRSLEEVKESHQDKLMEMKVISAENKAMKEQYRKLMKTFLDFGVMIDPDFKKSLSIHRSGSGSSIHDNCSTASNDSVDTPPHASIIDHFNLAASVDDGNDRDPGSPIIQARRSSLTPIPPSELSLHNRQRSSSSNPPSAADSELRKVKKKKKKGKKSESSASSDADSSSSHDKDLEVADAALKSPRTRSGGSDAAATVASTGITKKKSKSKKKEHGECPEIESCALFNVTTFGKLSSTHIEGCKKDYCKKDYEKCARYIIASTVGKTKVPVAMLCDDIEMADEMLVENGLKF